LYLRYGRQNILRAGVGVIFGKGAFRRPTRMSWDDNVKMMT